MRWELTKEGLRERDLSRGNHRGKGSEVGGCGTERVAAWRNGKYLIIHNIYSLLCDKPCERDLMVNNPGMIPALRRGEIEY